MLLYVLVLFCFVGHASAESFSIDVERYESNNTDLWTNPENSTDGLLMAHDYFSQRMNNKQNIEYVGTISLGEPPQKFSVIFDTGSDIFWVPRSGCRASGPYAKNCRSGHSLYSPKKSKTSKKTGRPFSIQYGTGSADGNYYTDVFSFGNPSRKQMKLKSRVMFGAASRMTFSDQGILGLPSGDTDAGRGHSVFHLAVKDGLMDDPIFTAFLRRCPSGGNCARGGTITFGAIDKEHCGHVEGWVNVDHGVPHWRFSIDSISVGGFRHKGPEKVISDTGTSDILVSSHVARGIAHSVGAYGGNGNYFVACDKKFEIKLTINGKHYEIPAKQVLQPVGGGRCRLAVSGANMGFWILGDPFIRAYCQVHDVKKKRLGFAKVKADA